jgi:hypothetical protein
MCRLLQLHRPPRAPRLRSRSQKHYSGRTEFNPRGEVRPTAGNCKELEAPPAALVPWCDGFPAGDLCCCPHDTRDGNIDVPDGPGDIECRVEPASKTHETSLRRGEVANPAPVVDTKLVQRSDWANTYRGRAAND